MSQNNASLSGINISSSVHIPNGYRYTMGNKMFISSTDYEHMRSLNAEETLLALEHLKEVKMSLLPENRDGIFEDGPQYSQATMEKTMKEMSTFLANPGISLQLLTLLVDLGFEGHFEALGISEHDALAMDTPTLQRLINEKTGIVSQFIEQKEQETLERNKKFFEEMPERNRILF